MNNDKYIHKNTKYFNILTKKFILKYYYTKGITWMSKKTGINRDTIYRYVKKYGLKIIKLSERGKKIKRIRFNKLHRLGILIPWNKGKSLWKERPDLVLQMKKSLQGRRCNPQGEFKKGRKAPFIGKNSRKNQICRHHIDLDIKNNNPNNLLFLLNSFHNSLHKRAYDYLVRTNQIKDYLNWFIIMFKPTLYKGYKDGK